MTSDQGNHALPTLPHTTDSAPAVEAADRQLLQRFVTAQDQAAFAALVRRHGPMVLGVCRRLLSDAHEAEDAFQATFLVLVHKARSVRRPERLGPWLHGVACRVAAQARDAARRRARQREAANMPDSDPTVETVWRELRGVLDEELGRLAEKYRAPLVLHYLEGKSTEEVARQLGCARGTVLSRLARGRDRLRDRLVRRGVTLTVWGLALALAEKAAPAAVPAALAEGTVQEAAAGVVPAAVAALTRGVLRAMLLSKLRVAGVVLLAVAAVAGIGVGARLALADNPAAAGKDGDSKDEEKILGTWVPVSEERAGEKKVEEQLKGLQLIFAAGGQITQKQGEREEGGTYKLDPTKRPREIDVSADNKMLPGIYKIEGDTLTVCVDHGGMERPTEFAAKPGTHVILVVLKREKK
jgi:RNA polymerase sigma factor (sigma-70 family)